jgi:hypothetical protein
MHLQSSVEARRGAARSLGTCVQKLSAAVIREVLLSEQQQYVQAVVVSAFKPLLKSLQTLRVKTQVEGTAALRGLSFGLHFLGYHTDGSPLAIPDAALPPA